MKKLAIDRAQPDDLPAIAEILNEAIRNSAAVWYHLPRTLSQVDEWYQRRMKDGFPVLVARRGGAVVGFTSYGQFRSWPGYRHTVELTIFVHAAHRRQGIGQRLINTLIDHAQAAGMHTIVAAVEAENIASLELHRGLGFVEVGRMPEVGRKFDRWLTLVLLQRML